MEEIPFVMVRRDKQFVKVQMSYNDMRDLMPGLLLKAETMKDNMWKQKCKKTKPGDLYMRDI